jgi:hypothetical protein
VVFVAPYFLPTTSRFLAAALSLPGVSLGLVTHEPLERVPDGIRGRLAAHYRVDDALDPAQLVPGVRGIQSRIGAIDCLMGPLEELQVPMAEVRRVFGIPGIDVDTARNFRDKDRMKRILKEAGLPCARHRLVGGPEEAMSFIEQVGFPVVAKPPAGSGSRNTFRINSAEQARDWLQWSPPNTERPTLLEEFVVGDEHAFDCVFVDGRARWWNISQYHPTPLEVMENPWIQWGVVLPRDISGPEYAAINHAGPAAIAAFGLRTGLVHMEWFRRADGSIAISEAAVRPPGAQFSTLISYAHDFDLYSAWARLMIFREFDPPERRYAVGAAYLRGQGDGKVRAIHGLEEAQYAAAGLVIEVKLPEEGQPSTGHHEGEGYVIVRHPETSRVEKAVASIVGHVRVELA